MKRSTLSVVLVLSLLMPLLASAAFERPSDLLTAMTSGGKPREFSGTFYAKIDDFEPLIVSGSFDGAAEGTETANLKAKFHGTVAVASGADHLLAEATFLIYEQKLYVRIENLAWDMEDNEDAATQLESLKQLVGTWLSEDLSTLATESQSYDDVLGEYAQILQDAEVNVTADDLRAFANELIDAALSMEHRQFVGGHAYTLSLRSDAIAAVYDVLQKWLPIADHTWESTDEVDRESLEWMQEQMNDALTVRAKIDTNASGDFRYGKYYVAFDLPESGMYSALEMKVQHRPSTVYLDVPKTSENLSDKLSSLFDVSIPDDEDLDWEDEDWEDWEEDDWEDWEEEDWEDEDWTDDESTESSLPRGLAENCGTTGEDMQLLRRGACGIQRPSHRLVEEATLRLEACRLGKQCEEE